MSDAHLPELSFGLLDEDPVRSAVVAAFLDADPEGKRAAAVIRETFDQLYDGPRTGRFRWDQLYKTEKTHFGTLFEINLRREFDEVIQDGELLDYRVLGNDIDCKYSQSMGGWMLPPECFGRLLLVATANDAQGTWSLGVVRASDQNRRSSQNRDGKTSLSLRGRGQIEWIRVEARLPPNVLLGLDDSTLAAVLSPKSGQQRVTELLRRVTETRIGRNTIATLAMQSDYMARIRDNGNGARTTLRREGYLIPGGDYQVHRQVALQLGVPVPEPGEVVSVRVVPTEQNAPWSTELDGRSWRAARADEQVQEPAPRLPDTKRPKAPSQEPPTNVN